MRVYTNNVPEKILIVPFGDIQFTGLYTETKGGCSVKYLEHFLSIINRLADSLDAKPYFIGTGDYVDLISPSNRSRYMASGLYSPARRVITHSVWTIVEELYEILRPFMAPSQIVSLCRGHHWFSYDPDLELPYTDTDRHLAAMFNLAKREDHGVCEAAGLADFRFSNGVSYRVQFQHGQGNGQSLAYGLNKLDKMASGWEGVDAHIMGHTHKQGAIKKARLDIRDGKIIHRDIRLITSGSFLKGWELNEVLYPEEKQMGPLALGGAAIYVEPDSTQPRGHMSFSIDI